MLKYFISRIKQKQGFTLIELLVAITIITILSTIGLVSYSNARVLARDTKRKQDLKSIAVALDVFYLEYKRYPCSNPNSEVRSTNPTWLTDSDINDCISPGERGTGKSLAPTYMNVVPVDPVNSDKYFYNYISNGNMPGNNCTNKDFILYAKLENPKDTERAGNSPTRIICGNLNVKDEFGEDAFVIKMP